MILIYSTFAHIEDAKKMAKTLLEERHIACANLLPQMTSLYQWEGQLQESHEIVMIAKTTEEKQSTTIARITKLHPYECPCVIAWKSSDVAPAFLSWVKDELS